MCTRSKFLSLSLLLLTLVAPESAEAKKFEIDPNHSYFAFTASTVIFDRSSAKVRSTGRSS